MRFVGASKLRTLVVLVAVLLGMTCATASAQSEGLFAVGPQVSFHYPVSEELENSTSFGVAYRFGRPAEDNGWGPEVGFGWFGADFVAPLAGHLDVRPLLGGIGYHIVHGKVRTNFSALTGPAFNKVKVNDANRAAFSSALGIPVDGVDITRAWVFKPGARIGYDVTRRVGAFVAVDYELVRPQLKISSRGTTIKRDLKADTINLKVGFIIGFF